MPVLDLTKVPLKTGSIYPTPYADLIRGRSSLRLAEAGGLTQFGVNLVTLQPGALSSLRHWHLVEDEFVMITAGECLLVEDGGETLMRAGDCAAFPANIPNGHHFINRSAAPANFLVIGSKAPHEVVSYADVDLVVTMAEGRAVFSHKDGSSYSEAR
jgi:uncharacterized cupin superfamily protein